MRHEIFGYQVSTGSFRAASNPVFVELGARFEIEAPALIVFDDADGVLDLSAVGDTQVTIGGDDQGSVTGVRFRVIEDASGVQTPVAVVERELVADVLLFPLTADGTIDVTQLPQEGGYISVSAFERTEPLFLDQPEQGLAPSAGDDAVTTDEDVAVSIDVLANDMARFNGALSVSILDDPGNGSVEVSSDGLVAYTPDADFNGPDSFTYSVTDINGQSAQATVAVSVTPVNDAPVLAASPRFDVAPGDQLTVSAAQGLLAGAMDAEGEMLSLLRVDVAQTGFLSFDPDGGFTYTRYLWESARETVLFDVSDGVNTVTGTLTLANDLLRAQVPGSDQGETLRGGASADVIAAAGGADELFGFRGNDLLAGGLGNDLIDGGTGIDAADYSGASGGVSVYLNLSRSLGAEGRDTLANIEDLLGSSFDDRLVGDEHNNVLAGGAGNDILKGKGGDDTFIGGDGNDRITGADDVDTMRGDAGEDRLVGLAGADLLDGGSGDDVIFGGRDADTIFGGDGDDTLQGNLGNDLIDGGAGADVLLGGGSNDTLLGGDGRDFLFGGNGRDIVNGGAGDDVLRGGAGGDVLDGARDVFVFTASDQGGGGFDQVRDFEDGLDGLDVSAFGFSDFDAVLSGTRETATGLRLDLNDTDSVFIAFMTLAQFDASDVILG